MSDQINLAAAGNVLAPALAVLRKLGFKVTLLVQGNQSAEQVFQAEKPGLRLRAEDPLLLLGLAKLVETRGADWKPTEEEVEDFLQLSELRND